jgi:HK97 family phage major capsid protein
MPTTDTESASGQPLDPRGGYSHAGEFLKDVWLAGRTGRQPVRLAAWHKAVKTTGHMAEGDDSQGGFLVPTQFVADLQMQTMLDDGIPGMCTPLPVESSTISIPFVNDVSHTGGVYGGVVVKRTGEGAQKLYSKPTLGLCTLTLHKLTILTYVSEELMEDSPASVGAIFAKMFAEALSHMIANDLIDGTGAGMGLGIINAPATIHVVRAVPGQIEWVDVVGLWSRLHPRCIQKAVWLANTDTMPQLMQMHHLVGAGNAIPVYQPGNKDSVSRYGTLMGIPLMLTEHAQSLGDTGDLILADLSQMLLARKGPKVDSSIHLRFDYNEQTFRAVVRYDCQPWWPAPVTPKHGDHTVSPFVVLDNRPTTTTTAAPTTTSSQV